PNGNLNAIYPGFDAQKGFTDVTDGSSFIQVVTWHDATGCPDVANILSYSLSADPTSPHFADQTRLFSAKQWVQERFCAADIAASPGLQTTQLGLAETASTVAGATTNRALLQLPNTGASGGPAAALGAVVVLGGLALGAWRRRRSVAPPPG